MYLLPRKYSFISILVTEKVTKHSCLVSKMLDTRFWHALDKTMTCLNKNLYFWLMIRSWPQRSRACIAKGSWQTQCLWRSTSKHHSSKLILGQIQRSQAFGTVIILDVGHYFVWSISVCLKKSNILIVIGKTREINQHVAKLFNKAWIIIAHIQLIIKKTFTKKD